MKLHFLGANRQVTGSRYGLEIGSRQVLIDCGLFQERKYLHRNWDPNPIPPAELDALILTHAHIDHSGLIPRLVQQGFRGRIHCTWPTSELAAVLLEDSAEIQEEDAAYKRRRHRREGRRPEHPEVPLYTPEDVDRTLPLFEGAAYGERVQVHDALAVTFHDAGHILGSAMLEVEAGEGDERRVLLFSGDIGQWGKPLIKDPTLFSAADYVIMESTYGDRDHADGGAIDEQLADVVLRTVRRGGNVVIPTFAVERAQELMYHISRLVHQDRIPDIKIYLDSPMAVDVTGIFRSYPDYCDRETWDLITRKEPPLHFPGLHLARSVEESKAINRESSPCIIMASSGMCTGGRIKHHLRRNIERAESTVLFVGYQAHGTLGRQILERRDPVRIHGRYYTPRAEVAQLYGFSAHADRGALLRWITHFQPPPRRLFLTHGEEDAAQSLAEAIDASTGCVAEIPAYGSSVTL